MSMFGRFQESKKQWRNCIVACFAIYALGFLFFYYSFPAFGDFHRPHHHHAVSVTKQSKYVKPDNITVSGLVFYGRQSRVEIMKCYIERNLIENGGWLDEVLWVVNTEQKGDLRYLEEILASNPQRYKKIYSDEIAGTYTYKNIWKKLERGKYYVKIDDDVVWIDDGAIPSLVTRKVQNPKDFVVSGNIINNPPLGFFHMRMGAIHPYFPEAFEPFSVTNATDYWRPSRHPSWDGPKKYKWELKNEPPSWPHHRWLRVPDDSMLDQTPAAELKYDIWGDSYRNWAIASQMHMSLFENIEKKQLDLYRFEKTWTMYEDRIRINFMCIYSDDILDTDPENWPQGRGDEDMIVLDLPKKLRRRKPSFKSLPCFGTNTLPAVVIQGDALAAHYQYMDQKQLESTDILRRYQSIAKDKYCLNLDASRGAAEADLKQRSIRGLFSTPSGYDV
ncbi:hypothetical protein FMUND_370 [Fusarium mundagurra]|uniref:Uncharacterized protein n=1 Tax=Fusarium mundagurra TaxID=1567541 RepID=A0A8H6DPS6_9HYPO|nr:hypothetical protein FMUND_370 [Fusarium mundagurra]